MKKIDDVLITLNEDQLEEAMALTKEIEQEVAVIQPKPVMLFGYTEEQWSKLS